LLDPDLGGEDAESRGDDGQRDEERGSVVEELFDQGKISPSL